MGKVVGYVRNTCLVYTMQRKTLALLNAIVKDMVFDLGDRGLIDSIEACRLAARLDGLASLHGLSLLTERLPAVGKAFDAYLACDRSVTRDTYQGAAEAFWVAAEPIFGHVLTTHILGDPEDLDPRLVRAIREITYLYYKYDAPYEETKVKQAIDKFVETEASLGPVDTDPLHVAFLERLFRGFRLDNITPRHGPGSVAGHEVGPDKYKWSTFPERLVNVFSYDYFVASPQHLSEVLRELMELPDGEPSARLLTVPKDSRGPRIISCEPKEFQWIQQGIRVAMADWIERHPLTRGKINFTDQTINGRLALEASRTRAYATLDLSEASDRVTLEYVEKHFPKDVSLYLLACRSLSTVLPSGCTVALRKFAPMGSACCFPVLATVVYTCLHCAGITNSRVYGDDVIVPTAKAVAAIAALEKIGLKVNLNKTYTTGFFRESCGVDAYKGVNVTPLRIKAQWRSSPHPDHYVSYIAYANALHDRGYVRAAERLARELVRQYGPIYQNIDGALLTIPHFKFVVAELPQPVMRYNRDLQRMEVKVTTVRARRRRFRLRTPYMILHWLANAGQYEEQRRTHDITRSTRQGGEVSWYTRRNDTRLHRSWCYPWHVLDGSYQQSGITRYLSIEDTMAQGHAQ